MENINKIIKRELFSEKAVVEIVFDRYLFLERGEPFKHIIAIIKTIRDALPKYKVSATSTRSLGIKELKLFVESLLDENNTEFSYSVKKESFI